MPQVYGFAAPPDTSEFKFTSALVTYNSIDMYDKYLVAGGSYEISSYPAAMVVPDLTLDNCEVYP